MSTNGTASGHRPASFLPAGLRVMTRGEDGHLRDRDPAFAAKGAAPLYSRFPVPHVQTFQGLFTTASRVYLDSDEARRDSFENARIMRNDCGVMECIEARQRATALLDWHLEPEDGKSRRQRKLCDELTKILLRVGRLTELRRVLMEAIWYGRSAAQLRYLWATIGGTSRVLPVRVRDNPGWHPIHGDKLVWRYESRPWDPRADQLGIRVSGSSFAAGDSIDIGNRRAKIEATDRGLAYFLEPFERDCVAVHKHFIEDGEYEDVRSGGKIHGVGIRSRIYWDWLQKQETLAFLMEFLERSAGGIQVWTYPEGNKGALEEAKAAAKEVQGGGKNVVFFPKPLGDDADAYRIDIIEPGMGGVETLHQLLTEYFGHRMKRYVLGQTLSTEAASTGLGSGVAELHLDSFLQIVRYDANNLDETLTHELVQPLQRFNFPDAKDVHVRFVSETEEQDVDKRLDAVQKAWTMGTRIAEREVYDLLAMSPPARDERVLENQAAGQPPGAGMFGGPGPKGDDGGDAAGGGSAPEPDDDPSDGGDDGEPDRYAAEFREEDHPRDDAGRFVGAAQVHYSDLQADPKRFQYKFQGVGEEGVTDELKGVKKFNPMLGGQVLAWVDPDDGKAYVVNGHHRHELARRSGEHEGWDGRLSTYFVDARDAKEARALGALANIAEGRGTAVDAAKFLRDTGIDADKLYGEHGISLKGAVARDAQILTNLSDPLFQRLAEGRMGTGRALAIASELSDHDKQSELIKRIEQTENKRGKELTDSTVKEMARMMDLARTSTGEGGGLFDDFEGKSSFVERAELLAHLRRQLSSEHKTFKQAASERRQAALESTGTNRLDVEGNRERAKAAETVLWDFDKRANARGDALATALSDAAEELANAPRKRKSIEKRLVESARGILAADAGAAVPDRGDAARHARPGRDRQPARYSRTRSEERMTAVLARILGGPRRYEREFVESEHPRNADGEFATKGAAGTHGADASAKAPTKTAPATARKPPGSQLTEAQRSRAKSLGMTGTFPPADVPIEDIEFAPEDATAEELRFKPIMKWTQRTKSGRISRQYRYTQDFHDRNAAAKFDRVTAVEPHLGKAVETLHARMAKGDDAAAIASVIAETGLRPTDDPESVRHGHFGIASLRAKHAKRVGDEIRLDFIGKEGVRNKAVIRDPANVSYIAAKLKERSGDEPLWGSDSTAAGAALKDAVAKAGGPADVKLKDLRTIKAMQLARQAVRSFEGPPPPLTGNEKKDVKLITSAILKMSGQVAERLNNTATQARDNYIHPEIFKAWINGLAAA